MLFQDDRQRAAVCRAVCELAGLDNLWDVGRVSGPTKRAKELRAPDGPHTGELSHGEQLLLAFAWDLWNGRGHTVLDSFLTIVDADKLAAIGALLVAAARGPSGIDEWLAEHPASSMPSGTPQ